MRMWQSRATTATPTPTPTTSGKESPMATKSGGSSKGKSTDGGVSGEGGNSISRKESVGFGGSRKESWTIGGIGSRKDTKDNGGSGSGSGGSGGYITLFRQHRKKLIIDKEPGPVRAAAHSDTYSSRVEEMVDTLLSCLDFKTLSQGPAERLVCTQIYENVSFVPTLHLRNISTSQLEMIFGPQLSRARTAVANNTRLIDAMGLSPPTPTPTTPDLQPSPRDPRGLCPTLQDSVESAMAASRSTSTCRYGIRIPSTLCPLPPTQTPIPHPLPRPFAS
mmetsp:Transcript_17922/g.39737  ORF Transcript_17922/g.39737 Transcript_17922/m.39737 type:complete len:277 (+) Transcript_17922:182-1012(+)